MTLLEEIEQAFAKRQLPAEAVDPEVLVHIDSDVEDALWFTGRDWHDVTREDWEQRNSAIYFMSSDAFTYYLPSVLVLSVQHADQWLWPADSIIQCLDRSPSIESWDDFIVKRFLGLRPEEYEVLKKWILQLSEFATYRRYGTSGPGDSYGRAFDTIDLLQKETARREGGAGLMSSK
jgi:hypothetical protein